ncbi:Glycosyltransferase involved in cell wall bisynthesis [Parapedobacter luteus]|uniref:Glycosyltransferase involved in cell wall bisynthesis n=1 Tax=Parapedobacter luteus TaxID=623280 RepID=A0A1T5DFV9_9SPHI|nr:glycosyltransferase [Parapedobacter luteus]SKB70592.1 Glycosyltransferase involved in cell wall bisynthesis [Parapedobacter luteus]
MAEKPLVSVCIPVYNGAKFVQEALDSLTSQTYRNLEVIISDDCSEDNTIQICEKFQEKTGFPTFIYRHKPEGIGANWNHCIEKANGSYIKFLFQDDILEPACIEKMLATFSVYPEVGLVACKRIFIIDSLYEGTPKIKKWLDDYGNLQKSLPTQPHNGIYLLDRSVFKYRTFFDKPFNKIGEPTAVMFRRELFDELGPFNTALKQMLDYEYWYRILKEHPIAVLDEALIKFRLHEDQTTARNKTNKISERMSYIRFIEKELFFYLSFGHQLELIRNKTIRLIRKIGKITLNGITFGKKSI